MVHAQLCLQRERVSGHVRSAMSRQWHALVAGVSTGYCHSTFFHSSPRTRKARGSCGAGFDTLFNYCIHIATTFNVLRYENFIQRFDHFIRSVAICDEANARSVEMLLTFPAVVDQCAVFADVFSSSVTPLPFPIAFPKPGSLTLSTSKLQQYNNKKRTT